MQSPLQLAFSNGSSLYVFHIRIVACVYDYVSCPDSSVTIVPTLFRFLSRSKRPPLSCAAPGPLFNWYGSRGVTLTARTELCPYATYMPLRHAAAQLCHFYGLFNDDVSNSEQQGYRRICTGNDVKGSGRSLLELPSGCDTAQHSRPAGSMRQRHSLQMLYPFLTSSMRAACRTHGSSEHFVVPS